MIDRRVSIRCRFLPRHWQLLPAALLCACVSTDRADILRVRNGVDVSYAGRFANHPAYRSLQANFTEIRQEALARVGLRLGIAPVDPDGIVVRFLDDGERGSGEGWSGWAGRKLLGDRKIVLVNVNLNERLLRRKNVTTLLAHELAHAVVAQIRDRKHLPAWPTWFVEGTATWGAAELENKLEAAFCFSDGPEESIDGLERVQHRASHRPEDYLEDALALEYVARQHGLAAVLRLVQLVVDGADPPAAFVQVCGADWETLQDRIRSFALESIRSFRVEYRQRARKAKETFDQADLLLSEERFEEARTLLLQNIDVLPAIACVCNPPGEDWADYQLGRCEAGLGHRAEAAGYFRKVVDSPTAGSTIIAQSREWLRRLASGP